MVFQGRPTDQTLLCGAAMSGRHSRIKTHQATSTWCCLLVALSLQSKFSAAFIGGWIRSSIQSIPVQSANSSILKSSGKKVVRGKKNIEHSRHNNQTMSSARHTQDCRRTTKMLMAVRTHSACATCPSDTRYLPDWPYLAWSFINRDPNTKASSTFDKQKQAGA